MVLLRENPAIFFFDFEIARGVRTASQGTVDTNQEVAKEVAHRVFIVAANAGRDKIMFNRGQEGDVSASIGPRLFFSRVFPIFVEQVSVP